jgi:hypothetical protein
MVKSVFDLYRGPLAEGLGLILPKDPSEQRDMWRQVSRMMVFRSHDALLAVAKYREGDSRAEDETESRTRNKNVRLTS